MRPSRRSAASTLAAVLLLLCAVPGSAEESQTDSLVWYVEQLEHDLDLCRVLADDRADSLGIELDMTEWKLEVLRDQQPRWYQQPGFVFAVGVMSTVLVGWAVGQAWRQ